MFTMSQHQYVYAAAPAPRHFSNHGTSSAFSSSANPDEDWTKISDLAERRRIQNRIAQRNYRKKLKRRLEDLERRAGTSDGASSSSGTEKTSPAASRSTKKSASPKKQQPQQQQQQPQQQHQHQQHQQHQHQHQQQQQHQPQHLHLHQSAQVVAATKHMQPNQFTPPMHPEDDLLFAPAYDDRERSHTPPMFTYPTYPAPEEVMLAPYGSAPAPYHQRPMAPEPTYQDWTSTAVPVSLPPMNHFSDAIKREAFANDETLSPYMNYGFLPVEVNPPTPYDHHSNPNTPPLSHSFDHSTNCSDSGYDYPTTPLSMPGSPGLAHN